MSILMYTNITRYAMEQFRFDLIRSLPSLWDNNINWIIIIIIIINNNKNTNNNNDDDD